MGNVIYDNKLFIFGGDGGGVWKFDPFSGADGSWQKVAELPDTYMYNKEAVLIKDTMYLFGGSEHYAGRSPTNNLWAFDPVTYKFTALSSINTPPGKHSHSLTVHNHKMYMWNGDNGANNVTDEFWVYDPAQGPGGTWQKVEPLGAKTGAHRGGSIDNVDGNLYLFGGYNTNSNVLYRYEP